MEKNIIKNIENLIREFQDKVCWIDISRRQDHYLSEDFIREFQDKVYWKYISLTQKISGNFILEFKDKIDFNLILDNKNLSLLSPECLDIIFSKSTRQHTDKIKFIKFYKIYFLNPTGLVLANNLNEEFTNNILIPDYEKLTFLSLEISRLLYFPVEKNIYKNFKGNIFLKIFGEVFDLLESKNLVT